MPTITPALRQAGTYVGVTYASVLALALALSDSGLVTVLMMGTPTLGVAVTIALTARRGERRSAWADIGFRPSSWRGYLIAVVVPAALAVASFAVAAAIGVARFPHLGGVNLAALAVDLFVTGTVLALGEEIGWRGYLLPRLATVVRGSRAALLTGAAHAVFHLPALLITTVYQSAGSRLVVVPTVMVTITLAGVFYAWLRRSTGSIWPVAVAHSALNSYWTYGAMAAVASSPAALAYVTTETGIATMLLAAAVATWLITRRAAVLDGPARTATHTP